MGVAAPVLAAFGLSLGQAHGDSIDITFDQSQLVNDDPILNFSNDGMRYRGIGPGPNPGVLFPINARVFTHTRSLVGTFAKPGIMILDRRNAGDSTPAPPAHGGHLAVPDRPRLEELPP
jgi:hypothetical protein